MSWLLDREGSYLQSRGEPRAALPLLHRAHRLARQRLGDDHPDTLAAANSLAADLAALGEEEGARAGAPGRREGAGVPPRAVSGGGCPTQRGTSCWTRPRQDSN